MTIFTAKASKNKKIYYLKNERKNYTFYMAILPFEFINETSASNVAADMVTQGDVDSVNNNEPKESRSTVTLLPATNFDVELKNDILKFANHQLSDITYFAVRMFIYSKNNVFIPFFGTISYNEGNWDYSAKIEKNVLAYEFVYELNQKDSLTN